MARTLVAIDTTALNIGSDIVCQMHARGDGPVAASSETRRRAYLPPRLEEIRPGVRRRGFRVSRARGSSLTDDEFNALVYGLFDPDAGERVLSMRTDPDDEDTEHRAFVTIPSFGEEEPPVTWVGTFEFAEPSWFKVATVETTANPLSIGGNVAAKPVIRITGAASVTRRRVTLRDRTGHGFAGFPVRIPVGSADNTTFVFLDGLQIPYALESGDVIIRAAAKAEQSAYCDVYTGTGFTNSDYADRLDAGGMDLATVDSDGDVEVEAAGVRSNPASAALSWRPGITVRHPESRLYTFGLDGDELKLIDREATGERVNLADDADSLVLASPCEVERISGLSMEVEAGWKAGANEAKVVDRPWMDEPEAERVMRVTMAQFDGEPIPTNKFGTVYWDGQNFTGSNPAASVDGGQDYPWYVQWTFGQTTFPHTGMFVDDGGGDDSIDRWYNVAEPSDFPALAAAWIGVPMTTGEPGVHYLHFAESSFSGVDIPLMSMTITPRAVQSQSGGDTDRWPADAGPKPAELFEAVWVDPETLEPIEEGAVVANEEPLAGQVRAVVRYLPRDAEDWVTAETWDVLGVGPDGTVEVVSDASIATPGAVAVAISLEASAVDPNAVDWGTLRMTASPVIELASGTMPSVSTASVAAQRVDGILANTTTGQQIRFANVFSDSGGLEIDAANLSVRGVGGVGPVYGEILPSGGVRFFDLPAGDVAWSGSHLGTVTFVFAERLRI